METDFDIQPYIHSYLGLCYEVTISRQDSDQTFVLTAHNMLEFQGLLEDICIVRDSDRLQEED
jgi:hypothetical protein